MSTTKITTRGVGIFFAILGACLLMFFGVRLAREYLAYSWPTAVATISSSSVPAADSRRGAGGASFYVFVHYSFTVDGKSFEGDRYYLTTDKVATSFEAAHVTERLAAGGTLPVHYNPSDPTVSCLRPGGAMSNWIRFLIALVGVGAGVAVAVYGPQIDNKRRWG